ncbi:LysR substrate-binding domain-containing protein [Granulosicoccus sp. 3-233]|uniref:LysR family transcriptional regulator n=1 Tax=Granulosicoccus sp. 3-233 TaxID=3417969 RepID=UPI003D32DD8A
MKAVSDRMVFTSVVDEGSLTRAAERLGLSLAVCSRRLAVLEKRLGVRLLNRTTRSQHLTDEGAIYYEHCLRIQEDIDAVEASLAGMRDNVQGTLRVSTSSSFGRKHVSPFVTEFIERYPGIRLQLMMSDNIVDLVAEGIDVAIRIGAAVDSSFIAARLATNRRILCASRRYLERAGTPQTLEELSRHQCLILSSQGASNDVWEFDTDDGKRRIPVSGPITSNSGEVVRDAAVGGLGIAVKSLWDITEQLRSGELVSVLDTQALSQTNIHALYHNRQFISPKVRVWIEFFREKYSPVPYWEQGLSLHGNDS